MTKEEFRAQLSALDLSLAGFARLVGVSEVTVKCWGAKRSGRDVQDFPAWVPLLLKAWHRLGAPKPPGQRNKRTLRKDHECQAPD